MRNIFRLLVLLLICLEPVLGQARVDRNVIFGMYSGLALLMDVHYPEKSNGHGIVFISGSPGKPQVMSHTRVMPDHLSKLHSG